MGSGAWSVIDIKIFVVNKVKFTIFKRMNHYLLHRRKIDMLLASFNYGPGNTVFIRLQTTLRGKVFFNSRFADEEIEA